VLDRWDGPTDVRGHPYAGCDRRLDTLSRSER
jgi:hypothetical protein